MGCSPSANSPRTAISSMLLLILCFLLQSLERLNLSYVSKAARQY